MKYQREQAEMVYMSLLHTLKSYNIPLNPKHEQLSNELVERHEAVDLLDLLDGLHEFIVAENEFEFDEE